ncbi:MAG: hypothetical protein AAGJ35_00825 [Myxococcota bacterium]
MKNISTVAFTVGLGILCLCIFGFSLTGHYVWDDVYLVQFHPSLRPWDGWKALVLKDVWGGATGRHTQLYHPLPMLSFWLEAQTWGLSVWRSRLLNVWMHGCCGLGIYVLLRRWSISAMYAWCGVFVFVSHPIVTEPVMWLTGRHDLMGVLFGICALAVWPNASKPNQPWLRVGCASGCVLLAFFCKEPYLVLPLLLFFQGELQRDASALGKRRWLWYLLPILALLVGIGWRTFLGISAQSALLGRPVEFHAQSYTSILHHYLPLLFTWSDAPTLSRFTQAGRVQMWISVLWVLSIWSVLLVLWWRRGRREPVWGLLLFAGSSFLVLWSPHLLSMPMIGMFANRYAYFPWLFLSMFGVGMIWKLGMQLQSSQRVQIRRIFRGLMSAVVCILVCWGGWQTALRAHDWQSNEHLYAADIARTPDNGLAYYHYGHALRVRLGCRRALPFFRQATVLSPKYVRGWQNTVGCMIQLAMYREALPLARRAAQMASYHPQNHYHLGLLLLQLGQTQQAKSALLEALARNPRYLPALHLIRQIR